MFWLSLIVGCSNSGLGQLPTADTAPPEPVSVCPWVGTWEIEEIACSAFAQPDWDLVYDNARLKIEDNGDDGCDVEMVLIGPDCRETEEQRWILPDELLTSTETETETVLGPIEIEVEYDGITKCNPEDACTFGDLDQAACLVGDREGGNDRWEIELDGDELTVTDDEINGGHLRATLPDCTLDVVALFSMQR